MSLIEAESTGPVEGDAPLVTPPRPPHRRVSVSLLFTLTVLTGTVVAIYLTFPARHNVLMTEAMAAHADTTTPRDLTSPSAAELRGWAIGVVGKDPPLPRASAKVTGARTIEIFNRNAAVLDIEVGGERVTYLMQRARGIAPEHSERDDGDVRAIAWKQGPYTLVGVGPAASAATWRAAFP